MHSNREGIPILFQAGSYYSRQIEWGDMDVEILQREDDHLELRAARSAAPAIVAQLLNTLPVIDLVVEDPPIEAVIDQVFQEGAL